MEMQLAPFIEVTGFHDDSTVQYFICAEQTIYLEAKKLTDAIIDLILSSTFRIQEVYIYKPPVDIFSTFCFSAY